MRSLPSAKHLVGRGDERAPLDEVVRLEARVEQRGDHVARCA